jgi:FtsH-binding integral membrane protein
MNKNTLKSIGAVLAGMAVIIALSVITDALVQPEGVAPSNMLALALVYRCVYGIAGGYVTATLAPDRPMRLVLILGIIGTALSILGVVARWDLDEHWYPIGIAITALPCVWIGGKLAAKRLKVAV